MDLLIKIASGMPVTESDIENELYEICDRTHSSCNSTCPVYSLNGNKVPDTANDFNANRGCDCFKSGKKMLSFMRNKI